MPDGGGNHDRVDRALLKVFSEVKQDVSAWSRKAERLLNALTHPESTDESVAPVGQRIDRDMFEQLYRKPLQAIVAILNDHAGPETFPYLPPDHPLNSLRAFIQQRNNHSWMSKAERAEVQLELERLCHRFDDVDFIGK